MVGGLVAAGLSAVLYGVASVFQAIAARRTAPAEGVDPRKNLTHMRRFRRSL
jgi:hypothetical protein